MNAIAKFVVTWFWLGLLRPGPGTWGSFGALLVAVLATINFGPFALPVLTLVLLPIAFWAISHYQKTTHSHDASEIVVDEVIGIWIALCFVPADVLLYVLGFVLFRLFDILKPWPVGWADRELKGATGVLADDVLAGIMAAAVLWALIWGFGGEMGYAGLG